MGFFKIPVSASYEDVAIQDFRSMCGTFFKFDLPLQIDISGQKKVLVNVVIKCFDGYPQLRMIRQDHVRRLPLFDQRLYDTVQVPEFFRGKINTGSGIGKQFLILSLGRFSIVIVFCVDRASVPWLLTAIADIGSFLNMRTVFPLKAWTDVVASVTGTAESVANDHLSAGIGLFAVVAVDTEVIGVIKAAPVPGIHNSAFPDFFGDRGGIFAEETGNLAKRLMVVKSLFNIFTVFEGKMFFVSRY